MWGWGQLSAGDRRGWLGPPAQLLALVAIVVAAPHAAGVDAPLVHLLAAVVLAAWATIAAHAWHRAARRRAALGAEPGGGAADLLWLTPLVIAAGSVLWMVGGAGSNPGLALDAYLGDWRAGRVGEGVGRFAGAVSAPALADAWARQDAALRNAVVRIVAAEPTAEGAPARAIDALRWTDRGPTPSGGRLLEAHVARPETVRGELFGLLPTTSRRLVPIEQVGTAELEPVAIEGRGGPLGQVVAWRIVRIVLAGETVGRP